MTWFKYLKDSSSSNYYSPPVKRKLKKIKPVDDISKGTWMYVDVSDLNINKKVNDELTFVDDSNSYIVVYEGNLIETDYVPVKSIIVDNKLYFAAAEDHSKGELISKTYSVYYMANNIRGLSSITSNNVTSYYLDSSSSADTYVQSSDISDFEYTIGLGSTSYYNFSFINPGVAWSNGFSTTVGATAYLVFSGPTLSIKGNKGPSGAKVSLDIYPIDKNAPASDSRSFVFDTYSTSVEEDVEIFRTSNLKNQDYQAALSILATSNVNSSGTSVKINSYSFNYNAYFTIGEELLKNDIKTISVGATAVSSSVVSGSFGSSETIYNNTYQSVDTRDVLVKMWMEV